jgi:hypothetical protein
LSNEPSIIPDSSYSVDLSAPLASLCIISQLKPTHIRQFLEVHHCCPVALFCTNFHNTTPSTSTKFLTSTLTISDHQRVKRKLINEL